MVSMQLKSLGKVAEATKHFNDVVKAGTGTNLAYKNILSGLDAQAKINIVSQSALAESQKLGALASAEVSAEELKAVVTTNALSVSEKGATVSTVGFGTAVRGLGAALKELALAHPILTAIVAVGTAIAGGIAIYDGLTTSIDEAKEKLDEAKSSYEESKTELSSLNDELKTTGERIDEINAKDNITFTERDELENLRETNDELERKIFLQQKLNEEAEKDVANEAQNTYNKYTNGRSNNLQEQVAYYENSTLLQGVNWEDYKGDISWLIAQYNYQQQQLKKAQDNGWTNIEDSARKNIELLEGYMADASTEYSVLYDTMSGLSDISLTPELKNAKTDLNEILDIVAEILGYSGERKQSSFEDVWNSDDFANYKKEIEELSKNGELTPEVLESNENYKRLLQETGNSAKETAEHINALNVEASKSQDAENSTLTFETITKSADDYFKSVKTVVSSVKDLNSAFAEQNENGSLSVDTMMSLIDAGYSAALSFDEQTGACTLNAEAMKILVKAKIENQIADLNIQKTNIVDTLNEQGIAATNTASCFLNLAKAKNLSAEGNLAVGQYNDANAQIIALQNVLKNLDSVTTGSFSTTAKKTKESASKASTDFTKLLENDIKSLDAQLDAGYIKFTDYLQKRKSLIQKYYDDAKISASDYYSYLSKQFEKDIDYMDRAISGVKLYVEEQISLLEEQKNAVEKSYKIKIDALELEKKKLQDVNKARKDQIALEQARYNAKRANEQEIVSLYTSDKGFINALDYNNVRDTKEALADEEYNIQLSNIENQINSLNDAMELATNGYQTQIDALNAYADKWAQIANIYEDQQNKLIAAEVFGQNVEQDVINMRLDVLSNFTSQYISLKQQQADAAVQAAKVIAEAEGKQVNVTTTDITPKAKPIAVKTKNVNTNNGKFGVSLMERHTGIDTGLVGSNMSKSSAFEQLKLAAKNGLKSNEELNVLKKGELVLTPEQWMNIAKNLKTPSVKIPDYSNMINRNNTEKQISLQIGDIYMSGVNDMEEFTDRIAREFSNDMIQKLNSL